MKSWLNGVLSATKAAFAGVALAAGAADAGTVAWFHFDEVAPGTRLDSGDEVLNAVDPTALKGQPYSVGTPGTGNYSALGNNADFMPMASNDVAETVYVVDPVGGTTNRNERSLFFTYDDDTANNNPARYGGGVRVASDSRLSLANLTVEFFVRPVRATSSKNGMQLVSKQSSSNNKFTYSICMSEVGKPYVNVYDSTGTLMDTTGNTHFTAPSPLTLLDGHWHHVAFTVNGTDAKLYLDYDLVATTTLTEGLFYDDAAPLYVGASQMGYYKPGGFIDEVRISDAALEPASFLRLLDTAPTCFHLDFEGTVRAELPHVVGTPAPGTTARLASGRILPVLTNDVPSAILANGLGETLRKTNACSVYLDGGCVKYPHLDILDVPEVTVECFVKYVEAGNYANILRFNKSNNDWCARPIWCLGFSNDKLFMRIDTTEKTNQTRTFGDTVLDGRWHHVAVTIAESASGITVKVYDNYRQIGETWNIDGILDYSSGSCLGLGLSSVSDAVFHGFVDEVRISRGVLSVDDFLHKGKGGTIIIFH